MGFNCYQSPCCFCCAYRKFWCCFRGKNKTSPENRGESPPSIALTIASRSMAEDAVDEIIQEQLSAFHFGQHSGNSPGGRRYSHPNQAKWVEEYERIKSQPASPSASFRAIDEPDDEYEAVKKGVPPTPPSPVMQYPVVPPGISIY